MCQLHTLHTVVLIIAKIRAGKNIRNGWVTLEGFLAIEETVLIVFRKKGTEASSLSFENQGTGAFTVVWYVNIFELAKKKKRQRKKT